MPSYRVACFALVCTFLGFGVNSAPAQSVHQQTKAGVAIEKTAQDQKISTPTPEEAIIVISGLCSSKGATKSSGCKTVITKGQFERVINAIQPGMSERARREFALDYANALVMAKKAEEMELDRGENYDEQMRLARLEILTRSLRKAIETRATQISEEEIQAYYDENRPMFERAEVDRLYIPKGSHSRVATVSRLAETVGAELPKKGEQSSISEAAALHASAVAGAQFPALQAQAYQDEGIARAAPDTKLWIRSVSLPPGQRTVMDMHPGELSPVLEDPNGYMFYKMIRKELLPFGQVHDQIRETLRARRVESETDAIISSTRTTLDSSYFKR